MLAYGDDYFETTLGTFLDGFERRLFASALSLEEARLSLIFAGQLEQAAQDAELRCAPNCQRLTATAAEAFVEALDTSGSSRFAKGKLITALSALRAASASEARVPLNLKTPEGFAWYALYPEAYVQCARQWMQEHAARRIVVIGIRSIGTTLAAGVAAALRHGGREMTVLTVRPTGHPFARRTALPRDHYLRFDHAIIVDEGPGLSGSSMASVGRALSEQGVSRQSITFFPGHQHGPGPQSSANVRRWWTSVQQVALPWHEIHIGAFAPMERLRESAANVLNCTSTGELIDLSAGKWRAHDPASNSALGFAPVFEQPKYLARDPSGKALLLKFAGFTVMDSAPHGTLLSGAEHQLRRLHTLAAAGFTPRPAGSIDGWLMLPWIRGRRLTRDDARNSVLHRIAAYVAGSAEPPLSSPEAADAFNRLRTILLANGEQLLGQAAADRLAGLADLIAPQVQSLNIKAYGDGRLAPHEWIDIGDKILKLDAAGHSRDHTVVGRQSLLWDVAGVAIEWQLEHQATCDLAVAIGVRGASHAAVSFYCAAYAAFRAGLAHMCAGASSSATERDEFLEARAVYSERLRTELGCMDTFLPQRAYIGMSTGPAI